MENRVLVNNAGFKSRFKSGLPAIEVARTILKSITSGDRDLMYLVGGYAFKRVEKRKCFR